MPPIWLRTSHRAVEIGVAAILAVLGGMLLYESIKLGPGWGVSGPDPGFFPFCLTVLMLLGLLGVVIGDIFREPNRQPFFEAPEEVEGLLKVGLPIVAVVYLIGWLGLYLTSGLYIAFFMAWYGRFRWYSALAGGVILPTVLWLMLREGFNISMPMSVFYRSGILPF